MVMWRTMMTAPSAPGGFECPPPPYQKPKAPNVWMINDGLGSRKSINAHIYTRSQNIASTPVTLKTALSLRAVSGARVRCLTCCPGWKGTREVLHCCTDKPRIDPLIIAMSITQRRKNYSQTKLQHSLGMPFFWHGKSNHIPGTGQAVLFTTLASRTSSGDTDMVSTATRFLPILVTRWLLAGCHVSPGCFPDVPFFVAIVVTCLQVDGGARSNCTSQFFCFGKGPPCSFVSTSLSLSLSGLARRRLTLVSISVSKAILAAKVRSCFPRRHFPPIYVMHAICVCVYVHGVPTQTQKGQKPELPCKLCRIFRHDNSVSKQTHFPQNIPSHTLLPAVMTFSLCRAEIDLWR